MKAARWWGVVPPSRFYEFDRFDQAVIVETYLSDQAVSAYQNEMERIKRERDFQNVKGRG